MYTPTFKCPHCGSVRSSHVSSPTQALFIPCDCAESRRQRELDHRAEIERRKRARRGPKRRVKTLV